MPGNLIPSLSFSGAILYTDTYSYKLPILKKPKFFKNMKFKIVTRISWFLRFAMSVIGDAEAEAGGPRSLGQSELQSEFKASLGSLVI